MAISITSLEKSVTNLETKLNKLGLETDLTVSRGGREYGSSVTLFVEGTTFTYNANGAGGWSKNDFGGSESWKEMKAATLAELNI